LTKRGEKLQFVEKEKSHAQIKTLTAYLKGLTGRVISGQEIRTDGTKKKVRSEEKEVSLLLNSLRTGVCFSQGKGVS